jgi:aconitate hydratase
MGQAPATHTISLRTVPRNFPGRSGTREDQVYLCSPETAAASALAGEITDPRTLDRPYPRVADPDEPLLDAEMLVPPPPLAEARSIELRRGPNIASLPRLEPLPARIAGPVLLKVGDDVSTDEILPAGARVLPYRSNIPKIAEFVFDIVDPTYAQRALRTRATGHLVVGGRNYGQGSSREHAALAPRYLGLHAVIARSFARIHWQNLINFGVLPLTFADEAGHAGVDAGDELELSELPTALIAGETIVVRNRTRNTELETRHALSPRQLEILILGGLVNWMKERLGSTGPA